MTPPWHDMGADELHDDSAEAGGRDRCAAYEDTLTSFGTVTFLNGGYFAEPGTYDVGEVRSREQVAADLAAYLSEEAAAELTRAAYAGLTPYEITPRQPDMEAGG